MEQEAFDDDTNGGDAASSVLFEGGPSSSVLFEAGAMDDDSFDTGATSDDRFADTDAAAIVDVYYNSQQAVPKIDVMCGSQWQVGPSLPRSFASSMLERCDEGDNQGLPVGPARFRRGEETPLMTTEVGVLGSPNLIQQSSEVFVAKQSIPAPQFAAVQVRLLIKCC